MAHPPSYFAAITSISILMCIFVYSSTQLSQVIAAKNLVAYISCRLSIHMLLPPFLAWLGGNSRISSLISYITPRC